MFYGSICNYNKIIFSDVTSNHKVIIKNKKKIITFCANHNY